ncbi:LOW QUALITY PROTEIN: olfactory receptor 2AP1-like [Discoglossus pictus]
MEKANQTLVTYFILTGVSDVPSLRVLIFLLVLLVYLLTIGGNMTILLLVFLDTQLHTPMYFFLANLAFLDMSSITITLHKILSSFISGDTSISFLGCMTQFFISSFTADELLILTVMSYDRYVAICNPLRYHVVMNHRVCAQLATCCYVLGFIEITPYIALFSGFTCYKSNIINHFFCDFAPLMAYQVKFQQKFNGGQSVQRDRSGYVSRPGMDDVKINHSIHWHGPEEPDPFVLKGISDIPELQTPIFLLVVLIYLIILGGNMTILQLICLDPHLHTPMYFFLGNLALLDISSTTVTLQSTLVVFITGDNTVSFLGCMSQMFIFSCMVANELYLLTAMSYDRYVAICNPLHYPMITRYRVCVLLVVVCFLASSVRATPYIVILSQCSCYVSNIINHFFCDLVPVMKLSCSDTSVLEMLILTEGTLIALLTPSSLTFISYVFIIGTILKIRSSTGRSKAFYTCSSHLTVVLLLYMTLICQYMRPVSKDSLESNKLFALFNTAIVPMLNPLIYSLKNKDVKSALRRQLKLFQNV